SATVKPKPRAKRRSSITNKPLSLPFAKCPTHSYRIAVSTKSALNKPKRSLPGAKPWPSPWTATRKAKRATTRFSKLNNNYSPRKTPSRGSKPSAGSWSFSFTKPWAADGKHWSGRLSSRRHKQPNDLRRGELDEPIRRTNDAIQAG